MNSDQEQPRAIRRDEEKGLVEARRIIMSGGLLSLSILAFVLYTAGALSPGIAAEFCVVFALVLMLTFLPRLISFRRQVQELLMLGTCRKPAGSRGQELRKAVATALSFILVLTAPLLLTRFLDPTTWIVVVTGFISGYAACDIFFTGYASLWQERRGILLRCYRLWAVGSDEKKILLESGIRRANR